MFDRPAPRKPRPEGRGGFTSVKGDLFLSQVKSHPARQWQDVSSHTNQAHVNVAYKLK
jgi:hypothetical protein